MWRGRVTGRTRKSNMKMTITRHRSLQIPGARPLCNASGCRRCQRGRMSLFRGDLTRLINTLTAGARTMRYCSGRKYRGGNCEKSYTFMTNTYRHSCIRHESAG
ncbi:hypothetical protein BC826DRAFT_990124 [Russula brevipes]|nr:hypothetical protein BC826DRAFT_990124 [Russula brevipes]